MIVKLEGRQPIFAFRTKNLHFFANGEFEEVFAINSKQDKEKAQLIPSVLTSILTKYCVEFATKTALSSNLRRLTKRLTQEEVDTRLDCACESYAALAEIAAQSGGTVLVENLPPVCVGKDIAEIEKLISADSRLRVCFDSNHLLSGDPAEFVRYFKDKIDSVHISDYDHINERHWLPGEGKNNWQDIYSALCEVGYKGPWLYEIAFISLKTLTRERDLTCADFVRNAHEIFENKPLTIIPGKVNV